jgi:hypothetical protein
MIGVMISLQAKIVSSLLKMTSNREGFDAERILRHLLKPPPAKTPISWAATSSILVGVSTGTPSRMLNVSLHDMAILRMKGVLEDV